VIPQLKFDSETVITMSAPTPTGATTQRLLALKIWNYAEDNSVQLAEFENLGFLPWHIRLSGVPQQQLLFHCRTIVNRSKPGTRQTVKLDDQDMGSCHTWVHPCGLACTVVTSNVYPIRVAYTLINEAVTAFLQQYPNNEWKMQRADTKMDFAPGQQLFDRFQNPMEADKIAKIERDLDEVKDIVVSAMDDVLRRGEKLEDLENKSKDVTQAAAQFRRQAQANNSCCSGYT